MKINLNMSGESAIQICQEYLKDAKNKAKRSKIKAGVFYGIATVFMSIVIVLMQIGIIIGNEAYAALGATSIIIIMVGLHFQEKSNESDVVRCTNMLEIVNIIVYHTVIDIKDGYINYLDSLGVAGEVLQCKIKIETMSRLDIQEPELSVVRCLLITPYK